MPTEKALLLGALVWPAVSQMHSLGDRESQKERKTGFIKSCHRFRKAAILGHKEEHVIGEYVEMSVLKYLCKMCCCTYTDAMNLSAGK